MHLTRRTLFIAILCLTGYGCHFINAQNSGFSQTYFFEQRSTIFHAVRQLDDRLIVVGEIGTDSFGNNGVFVANIDTFGMVHQLEIFQDPDNEESLDLNYTLSPWDAVIITDERKIVLACTFRKGIDLVLIEIEESMNPGFYKHFASSFKYAKYVGMVLEFQREYYIIGYYQTEELDKDIFVTKTDSSGNFVWENTYGTAAFNDFSTSAIVEEDGITLLAFESRDPNALIPNDNIKYNSMIHIDTSGEVVWRWKGELNEEGGSPTSLVKDGSDYFYITRPAFEEQNTLHFKPQIVCRDDSFNLKWREDYGEFYHRNEFTSLAFGSDGFLYAAGFIPDGWTWGRVCKIDPENGEVIWEARDTAFVIPGWGSRNRMQGLTVLPSGSVVAVGYTVDHTFHENGLLYKVTADGCIDTLCTTVAIDNLINNPDSRVRIYPNPATTDIFVDATIPLQNSKLNIYHINGTLVDELSLTEGKNRISILAEQYKTGLYFWHVLSKEGRILDAGKIYIQGID